MRLLQLVAVLVASFGCASIVSKSKYPISLTSKPSGAEVTVVNMRNNVTIFNGETPTYVVLKSGHKYFRRSKYQVSFRKDGYEPLVLPIEFGIDGWYFGNALFGTLIGFLIVDPATGAMYRLKTEFIVANLEALTASKAKETLRIYSLDEVPREWDDHIIRLDY